MHKILKQIKANFFKTKKLKRRRLRKQKGITKHSKKVRTKTHSIWHAPEMLSFHAIKNKPCATINSINQLHAWFTQFNQVRFDFSKTRNIYPDAAIYLLATISALKTKHPNVQLICENAMTQQTKEVLHQIGLLEKFNWQKQVSATRDDVKYWRKTEGTSVDGANYEEVLASYDTVLPESLQTDLYDAMIEAMSNIEHAYNTDLTQPHPFKKPQWWLFSQERDQKLSIIFCDVGVGIPTTLPRQPTLTEHLKNAIFRDKSHSKSIEVAIEYSQTRTKIANRGKGLHQIATLLKNISNSKLSIRSNAGHYRQLNHDTQTETILHDSKSAIIGTIVSWTIPLPHLRGDTL